MKMLQKMKRLQAIECNSLKKLDFPQIFLIFLLIKIDGHRDLYDPVDLIQSCITESEHQIFLLLEVPWKMMRRTGWKFGIMCLWNIIEMKTESSRN
jgi:hypothetical protein